MYVKYSYKLISIPMTSKNIYFSVVIYLAISFRALYSLLRISIFNFFFLENYSTYQFLYLHYISHID